MWMLRWSMAHRLVVVIICAVVVASIWPLYNYVGYNFLPDEDESAIQIFFRAPQGTSLAATQSVLDRIARDVREHIPASRPRWRRRAVSAAAASRMQARCR
jgi:HAE1 family hydrophobic/amphiphilic exporter-1